MRYPDEQTHLQTDIQVKGCEVPPDERARMQTLLTELGVTVAEFPTANLAINIVFHPHSGMYHAEFKLKLPGQTLTTAEDNAYLDSVFQSCLRKMIRKTEVYREQPDRQAEEAAQRRLALERGVMAPEDRDTGRLAEAVRDGDYRAFRNALVGYEDWVRNRVGRWVQRYPEAEAQVGDGLLIGDLVEEVYLNAFERFLHRSTSIRFSEWLDSLVDPSLKAMLRHPEQEKENASMARTLREVEL